MFLEELTIKAKKKGAMKFQRERKREGEKEIERLSVVINYKNDKCMT